LIEQIAPLRLDDWPKSFGKERFPELVEMLEGMVEVDDVDGIGKMEPGDGFIVLGAIGDQDDLSLFVQTAP